MQQLLSYYESSATFDGISKIMPWCVGIYHFLIRNIPSFCSVRNWEAPTVRGGRKPEADFPPGYQFSTRITL
jgi:hypothetical protein